MLLNDKEITTLNPYGESISTTMATNIVIYVCICINIGSLKLKLQLASLVFTSDRVVGDDGSWFDSQFEGQLWKQKSTVSVFTKAHTVYLHLCIGEHI